MGQLFWVGLLFGIAIKAFSRVGNPDWNGKAAVGLGLTCAAWGIISGAAFSEAPAFMVVSVALGVLLLPAVVVLGILALIELRRGDGPRLGRKYVAWSFVLMLLLGGMGGSAGSGLWTSLDRSLVDEMTSYLLPVQPREGEVIAFADKNLRLRTPRGWKRLDAKRINADATVAFGLEGKGTYAMVIAEDSDGAIDTQALARVWRSTLESSGGVVTAATPLRVNGLDGLRQHATLRKGLLHLGYSAWVTSRRGFYYQVVVWAKSPDPEALDAAAGEILDACEQLDPARESDGLQKPAGAYRSARWGYAIDPGPAWKQWKGRLSKFPSSDYGAVCGTTDAMAIFGLSLHGEEVPIGLIADGMLARIGLPRGVSNRRRGPLTRAGYQGLETEQVQEVDGTAYRYRAHTLRAGNLAITAATWTSRLTGVAGPCDGLMDKLVLDAQPAQPAPDASPRPTALLFNQFGILASSDGAWDAALRWYRMAERLDTADDWFVRNEADTLRAAGRPEQALVVLDAAAAQHRTLPALATLRPRLLAQLGRTAQAHVLWEGLFKGGLDDPDSLEIYAGSLEAHGDATRAIEVVADDLRRHDSVRAALLQSQLLHRKGETAKAVEVLELRRKKAGFEADVAYELVDLHLAAEGYAAALAEADNILARGFDSVAAHFLKARAQMGLRWYPLAKGELELALTRDPADAEVRRYLERVAGILGQGDSGLVKEPIEPVVPPSDLLTVPAVPATGSHAVYLVRSVAFQSSKGQPLRRSDLRVVRVEDQAGVDAFTTLQFDFDPLGEVIYVNRVRVRDGSGKVVSEGKPEDAYVLDTIHGEHASQRKGLYVPVQGLRPGLTLEVLVTRRDMVPSDEPLFVNEMMVAGYPVAHGVVTVAGDVEGLRARTTAGVRELARPGLRAFVRDAVPQWRWEPLQPSAADFLPAVWIGAGSATWAAEGKRYLASIAERLAPDPELKAIAASHAGRDPVTELSTFVQKELSYRAIEFGRSARMPDAAGEVLKNRATDCKGHALLLYALLRAAGVPASLALVRTWGKVAIDLPSLDQFDHMVVYVPGPHPAFVDTTDKYDDPAASLANAGVTSALVLDELPHLVQLPGPPQTSAVTIARQVLFAGNDLVVKEHVELGGIAAAGMRSLLEPTESKLRPEALQHALGSDGRVRSVTALEVRNLKEIGKPLLLEVEYREPGAVREAAGQRLTRLPAPWEHQRIAVLGSSKRENPAEFRIPLHLRVTTQVTPPPHAVLEAPRPSALAAEARGPTWRLQINGPAVVFTFERPAVALDAAEAERWEQAERSALAAAEQDLVLRPLETQAAR